MEKIICSKSSLSVSFTERKYFASEWQKIMVKVRDEQDNIRYLGEWHASTYEDPASNRPFRIIPPGCGRWV